MRVAFHSPRPVMGKIRAALALWAILLGCASAQDVFTSLAQSEAVVLDSAPDTDRPAPEPTLSFAPEPVPVLEQPARVEDIPGNIRGNRLERKWRIIPFGRVRGIWDDNLFISNTNRQSDFSYTLSPGIAAGWGDYEAEVRQLGEFEHRFEALDLNFQESPQSFFFAKYAGSASFFVENSGEDSFDHDALVAGRFESTKLTLGLRLRFQTLSGADIDIGDRVDRTVFTAAVTSSYKFSEKTSFDLNFYNTTQDYTAQIDWTEWMAETWLNYQIFPKTRISVGTRFGFTDIKEGSSQTFEQAVARISYYATSKLAFNVDGGVEWRQDDAGGGDELFTVFGATAAYAPFDGTVISLNGFRRNTASASLINETITATGVNARVRQRFLQRVYLTLEGGFQNSKYGSALVVDGPRREDDTVYLKPSISFDITKNFSAESAYQYQKNDSSFRENTFTENLFTLQLNLQF